MTDGAARERGPVFLPFCSHGVVEEVLVGEAYAVLEFGLIGLLRQAISINSIELRTGLIV